MIMMMMMIAMMVTRIAMMILYKYVEPPAGQINVLFQTDADSPTYPRWHLISNEIQ